MEEFSVQSFKAEKCAQVKENEYELEDEELETHEFELTTDYSRKVYNCDDQQLTLFYKAVFRGVFAIFCSQTS